MIVAVCGGALAYGLLNDRRVAPIDDGVGGAILQDTSDALLSFGNYDALSFLTGRPDGQELRELSRIVGRAAEDPRAARALAGKLVVIDSEWSIPVLERLQTRWMTTDPVSAIDWMLENNVEIDAGLVGNTARALATSDLASATEHTSRLAPEWRGVWMAAVATTLSRSDPLAAMQWLEHFDGQEGYATASKELIIETMVVDPRIAALVFERAPADIQVSLAQSMASAWVRQAPPAAAQWAAGLAQDRARANSVIATVKAWGPRDAASALRWVLSLPAEPVRDEALAALLPHSARSASGVSDALLYGFSSPELRQDALARVLPTIAAQNPAEARRLLVPHIVDPLLREQLARLVGEESLPPFADPR